MQVQHVQQQQWSPPRPDSTPLCPTVTMRGRPTILLPITTACDISVDTPTRSHTCNNEDENLPGRMSKSCEKMRMKVLATLDTAKHRAAIRGLEMGVNLNDSPRDWTACACHVGLLVYGRMCLQSLECQRSMYICTVVNTANLVSAVKVHVCTSA